MGLFSALGGAIGTFFGGPLGGAIGAGLGSTGESIFSRNSRRREQWRLNQYNSDMSWDMWNATNAYNHPANQMARYKAAGLNPHLIYGQQNLAGPIHVPSAVSLGGDEFDFGSSGISGYLRAGEKEKENILMSQTLQGNEFKLSSARAMLGYEIEQSRLMNERARLQNTLLKQQIGEVGSKKNSGWLKSLYDEAVKYFPSRWRGITRRVLDTIEPIVGSFR